jgi:hypothetical protein
MPSCELAFTVGLGANGRFPSSFGKARPGLHSFMVKLVTGVTVTLDRPPSSSETRNLLPPAELSPDSRELCNPVFMS